MIVLFIKNRNILEVSGNVILNNYVNSYNIYSNEIIYDKFNGTIQSLGSTKIELDSGYNIFK